MKFTYLLKRAFTLGYYEIVFSKSLEEFKNGKFKKIKKSLFEWYADPFIYVNSDNIFIFCEAKKTYKNNGNIGVFKFDKNFKGLLRPKTIIKEKFHLSFPNFFIVNNKFYIVPETCKSRSIRLYSSDSIDGQYHLEKKILDNCYYVDTIFINNLMFTYDPINYKLHIYNLNEQGYATNEIKIIDDINNKELRPAGNPISNNKIYFQVGKKLYGESMNIKAKTFDNELIKCNDDDYIKEIKKYANKNHCHGYHTLNFSGDYFVFDIYKERFSILKPLLLLIKKISKY